jgi:addiction module HigA family antidote
MWYVSNVIKGFADKETAKVFSGQHSRKLPVEIQRTALRKLLMLDATPSLGTLRVPLAIISRRSNMTALDSTASVSTNSGVSASSGGTVTPTKLKSPIITREEKMTARDIPPIHPGEILKEEFLEPLDVSAYRLAKGTHIPQDRVSNILRGKRSITADTALRLGRFFGVEPQFWLNLQTRYDLDMAAETIGKQIESEITPLQSAVEAKTSPF